MALTMLIVGALMLIAGVAMLSPAVAVVCSGGLTMAAAVAVAAVEDRRDVKAASE